MIPVFLHEATGSRGYLFDEFEAKVIQICEEHQRSRRACAFGFVLHDAQSPHIDKVLNDRQYWTALDSISGNALTVFSVFAGALRRDDEFPPEVHSNNMRKIAARSRRTIETHFGLERLHFPAILFFQVNEGDVLASRLVKLRARDTESAFNELRTLLELAAEAVRDSVGKPVRDPELAYERLDRALTSRSIFQAAQSLAKGANAIRPWIQRLFAWM